MALQAARDVYSRRGEVKSLWVVPASAITASTPSENGSFFDPSNDKVYRHPLFYKVPRGMKGF
jgi:ring-1,2-phenylacetyl-CoA epoxidase subunit PaaB